MRAGFKKIIAIIHLPLLIILLYVGYLWATYIEDVVTAGSKYGFTIGETKANTYKSILTLKEQSPDLKFYIIPGPRAGGRIFLSPEEDIFQQINKYEHWELLLDGENEFSNIVRLYFKEEKLSQIYRHRKYF